MRCRGSAGVLGFAVKFCEGKYVHGGMVEMLGSQTGSFPHERAGSRVPLVPGSDRAGDRTRRADGCLICPVGFVAQRERAEAPEIGVVGARGCSLTVSKRRSAIVFSSWSSSGRRRLGVRDGRKRTEPSKLPLEFNT